MSDERYRPCMGCSRAAMAAQAGFDWPCEGHDEGSTMARMEDERKAADAVAESERSA